MLDHLSGEELQKKRVAQSSDDEESTRHLTYDDLDAYVSGRLAPARMEYCRTHLDACDACRAELEDLRTFKSDLAGFQRPQAARREAQRHQRRRRAILTLAGTAITMFLMAISAALWWWHGKPQTNATSVVTTGTHGPKPPLPASGRTQTPPSALAAVPERTPLSALAAPPERAPLSALAAPAERAPLSALVAPPERAPLSALAAPPERAPLSAAATPTQAPAPTHDSPISDAIADLPVDMKSAVTQALQQRKLQHPTDPGLLSGGESPVVDTAKSNTVFALLGPFGTAIDETRPEFRWQPLAGAVRYHVTIVDAGLHPVQHSRGVRTTSWRPRRHLHRGQTYIWQVTATLRGGSKIVASGPPAPEAVLRVVPRQLSEEIAQFRKAHQDAHVVLGTLYAQAGMLTASADELKKVLPTDPSYSTAQALLESLPPAAAF